MPAKKKKAQIDAYTHPEDTRPNIPTAEVESVMGADKKRPIALEYERGARNTDLDPQLVWRGKDEQDQSDLAVTAPPIFIQEKVHPRVLIEDLIGQSGKEKTSDTEQLDLFADFNGLDNPELKGDYYEHEQNWSNRMILGDSLQVMASLASKEGYQGKVQCIYMDPPYGIRFNSNFQWSTTSRDVKDGNAAHITREPEQVKAFRDTWRDGIHSYLTYLRDRLTVARDLLADSGSIFVQIGDENVHRVRAVMDEVFGEDNFVGQISFRKKLMPLGGKTMENMADFLLWYAKDLETIKYRQLFLRTEPNPSGRWTGVKGDDGLLRRLSKSERRDFSSIPKDQAIFGTVSQWAPSFSPTSVYPFDFQGRSYSPTRGRCWVTTQQRMRRLDRANRLFIEGEFPRFISLHRDFEYQKLTHPWRGTAPAQDRNFVVETSPGVIERCILMTTDPGDLVLDPTCGSGTTAYVAEQWGRRWITIDTSRVALALARSRIMGARYPHYILADSRDGQLKEAELSRSAPTEMPTHSNVRQGFVYERVPHISLRDIANNAEIDVIYEEYQEKLEPLREELNQALTRTWEEWEIPREAHHRWPGQAKTAWEIIKNPEATEADRIEALLVINRQLGRGYSMEEVPDHPYDPWEPRTVELHSQWWEKRIARQKEIDASIAARAEYEYLYDKPYEDRSKVRVAGPFTVESLSPHRLLISDEADGPEPTHPETVSTNGHHYEGTAPERDFASVIIENLRTSGVQQANKDDKIEFNSIEGWPGEYICAEGEYIEGESEKRAGIFVGPEFGTVGQPDLTAAAPRSRAGRLRRPHFLRLQLRRPCLRIHPPGSATRPES